MFLFGGFKEGTKMNDIYKLSMIDSKTFEWELYPVEPKMAPVARASMGGAALTHNGAPALLIFGGNDNHYDK